MSREVHQRVPSDPKTVEWIASSKDDLSAMPDDVKLTFGQALFEAQTGGKHPQAKPLKGDAFKGAGVLEIVEDFDGDTFRAVYTVRLAGVVYVLHTFQKKSNKGAETPKHEIAKVVSRLKLAESHYAENYEAASQPGRGRG